MKLLTYINEISSLGSLLKVTRKTSFWAVLVQYDLYIHEAQTELSHKWLSLQSH